MKSVWYSSSPAKSSARSHCCVGVLRSALLKSISPGALLTQHLSFEGAEPDPPQNDHDAADLDVAGERDVDDELRIVVAAQGFALADQPVFPARAADDGDGWSVAREVEVGAR